MSDQNDSYDKIVDGIRKEFHSGSPLVFVVMSFFAILIRMIFAASSPIWAFLAGATDSPSGSVPASTALAGAWGDSFGAFNALVGALGFGAVAITLRLQYTSLERQKVDQHIVRFEDNFFRLLDLLIKLRETLLYEQTLPLKSDRPVLYKEEEYAGHAAIEAAFKEIQHFTFKAHNGRSIKKNIVAGQYHNYVHNRFEYCFAPYFRIIYTILFTIRSDNFLDDDQKSYYGNILRSQLTNFEIALLAVNATSEYSKDLQDLLTHFRMLKYLPKKRRKILGKIFSEEAYSART